MLAAVLKEVDKLVLEDVPIPEPGLGEVVVRIKLRFCATDYKAIKEFVATWHFRSFPATSRRALSLRWDRVYATWSKEMQ